MRPVVATGLRVRILDGNQMGIHFDRLALTASERLQEFLLPRVLDGLPDPLQTSCSKTKPLDYTERSRNVPKETSGGAPNKYKTA